ncbi:MAG: hypothetical protein R3277_05385 [Brumimicrobium sp.]|nr:hypothetical protein [Brumimicrobium sp.]
MIFGKKRKLIKNCALYISDKHNHLVIAARMENKDGLNMEQENSNGFDLPISEEDLGQEIIDAMNKYEFADIRLEGKKMSDWPAYKASKSKSIRAFENDYMYISISNQNEGNIIMDIEGRPHQNSLFWVKSTISYFADKSEIGKQLMQTFEICKTGQLN